MPGLNGTDRRQLVVVTGASTGMGAATARELADRGYHVLAGVRREVDADALRADGIEPLMLDITNASDVAAIAGRVADDPSRRPLRALINNAGLAVNAPVETLPMTQWRNLFEVNLFGHIAMIQALLPALLHSSGTIVNISSVGGKFAMATYGPYAASKFALEAASDSLRREVGPLGVKVVVVEPGAVKTRMAEDAVASADRVKASMTSDQLHRYADLTAAISAQQLSATRNGVSAERAAKVIATAATASRPRTRYAIGSEAALLWFTRLASDRFLDRVLALALRPHYVTGGPGRQRSHRTNVAPPSSRICWPVMNRDSSASR